MKQNPSYQDSCPSATTHAIRTRAVIVIAALMLLAAMANVLMTVRLAACSDARPVCPEPPRYLPCGALPLRLIHDDPACANTLLHVMNVTNVHILPKGSKLPPLDNETAAQLQVLCPQFANRSMPLPAICQPGRLDPPAADRNETSD